MKRLFLACPIYPEPAFRKALSSLQETLGDERISWVKPGNMHLTFKFFGETAENKIPSIISSLEDILQDQKAFLVMSDELGIFGTIYKPRVIWLGFDEGKEELIRLGEHILDGLDRAGWSKDRQNFVPHLTLGRIRRLTDRKSFQKVIDQYRQRFVLHSEVRNIILYQSILHNDGPEYRKLHSFPLN